MKKPLLYALRKIYLLLCYFQLLYAAPCPIESPFVIGHLQGQAGNNFFQIATASALAWDHGGEPFFPQLLSLPTLYQHYFSRCKISTSLQENCAEWIEPNSLYHPIVYQPNMKIVGYFQSWKYFDHYRDRLFSLFAPTRKDLLYIQKKYDWIFTHPNTVGIQIRYYWEDPYTYPQYGKDYLEKAIALFPENSLFIVSSNKITFAKEQLLPTQHNLIFLENEPDYIDFYLLTLCKHNIITNSTFGWWSAYLNQNSDKTVVCPSFWSPFESMDLRPENWIQIKAERMDPALIQVKENPVL